MAEENRNINVWTMIRDVLIHAISNGQFFAACGFALFGFILFKLSAQDVARLVFDAMIPAVKEHYLWGYVGFGVSITGWAIHIKLVHRVEGQEVHRISKEKNKLQEIVGGDKMKSSKE